MKHTLSPTNPDYTIVQNSMPDRSSPPWPCRILCQIDSDQTIALHSEPHKSRSPKGTKFLNNKKDYTIVMYIHLSLPFFLMFICILIPYPPLPPIYVSCFPRWFFPSNWTLCVFFIFPMSATGPAYFLFLDLITLIIIIIIIIIINCNYNMQGTWKLHDYKLSE
jgi:hypothetical protein